MRTLLLTLGALVAFAANSVLCRLALGSHSIDAASFTTLRLAAGVFVLALLARRGVVRTGSWLSALALFLYAAPFSFAYLRLDAGTGALLLFGSVQATMIASGLRAGERPHGLEWTGLCVAAVGLVYLVFPGIRAPEPIASALMIAAGVSWGVYSLRGRRAQGPPLVVTGGNFLRALPMAIALSVATLSAAQVSPRGAALALASGGLTSGLGYVIWYAALRGLSATRAATVQLAVPVLAALGGVALLDERVTQRLVIASVVILSGVALALRGQLRAPRAALEKAARPPRS